MSARLRVLLVDDHALVRAGIRKLLEDRPGVEVVGEANCGNDALAMIEEVTPDVVLMDISMPNLNGIEATRRATKDFPGIKVVMLSMHADRVHVERSLTAGAVGYVLKTASVHELNEALEAVGRGEVWLSPAISRTVVDAMVDAKRRAPDDPLTPRQREILQLIAEGTSGKDIAYRLGISVKTVDAHRAEIMNRLDIHHLAGLVHYAIRNGMIGGDR